MCFVRLIVNEMQTKRDPISEGKVEFIERE